MNLVETYALPNNTLLIESLAICLALFTTLSFTFGAKYKNHFQPIIIILASLITSGAEYLFFDSGYQYFIFLVCNILAGIIFSVFFTNGNIAMALALSTEYICCISVLKWALFISAISLRIIEYSNSVFYVYIYLLYIFFMVLLSFYFISHPLILEIKMPAYYWIISAVLPLLILLSTNFIVILNMSNISNLIMPLYSLVQIMLILLTHYLSYVNSISYKKNLDSLVLSQRLFIQLQNIKQSAALVEQLRRDKHEMKNVYFYIHSLLEEGNIDELSEFVNTKLLKRYDRLEMFHTGHDILDYLLSQKKCEILDANIQFLADIGEIPEYSIADMDLCGLLSNLIDNAIEASTLEDDPDIHLIINSQKNYIEIEISNKASENVLAKNPALSTTKDDAPNHGIGLRIVDSIVDKYNGMLTREYKDGYFVTNIMLKLN